MTIDLNNLSEGVLILKKKDSGVTIPFFQDQSLFEILSFFDDEYGTGVGVGDFNQYISQNISQAVIKAKKNIEFSYKDIKDYLFSDDYLSKCESVNEAYITLDEACRKYRRRRMGNPDVDAFYSFINSNSFILRCLRFDVAYNGLFINKEPSIK